MELTEYGARRVAVVAGIMLAVLLEILDTTIVNVALPTVQGNLGAGLDESSWVVTGYLIAVIIALPLVPWFESLLGRKGYCITAIVGFTITSCFCGLAQSLDALIAFRILQGLFGGGIVTIARAILRDTFPPEQIGRSQALLAIGAVVGPSVGPTVGGILTDNFSWRWIFFINLLPGLLSAAILWKTLREPKRRAISSDITGLVLMALGLGSLQYVLETGQRHDWFNDGRVFTFVALAGAALLGFCLWERYRAKNPIVDLSILRRPAVALGTVLSFAIGFTLFVGIVLGPQFTQNILGFTATMSGNTVLIRAVAIAAVIPLVLVSLTRLKIPARYLLGFGFALVGIAGILMSEITATTADFWSFAVPLAIGGFGFGLLFVPLSVSVLSAVPPGESSKASSMLSLFQQLGASFSTAIMVTIIDRRTALHLSTVAGAMTRHNPGVAAFVATVPNAMQSLAQLAHLQAVTLGFADANFVGGIVAFIMIPIALAAIRPKRSPA
jgi:DHA2 family multidrug resistance protein